MRGFSELFLFVLSANLFITGKKFLLANPLTCGTRDFPSGLMYYIIGGRPAFEKEFPWMVSVEWYFSSSDVWEHSCGGTLIRPDWVLTAAHCIQIFALNDLRVVVGRLNHSDKSSNGIKLEIEEKIVHSHFDDDKKVNDIGLLKLKEPVVLDGSYINSICLPETTDEFNGSCSVSGWGFTGESDRLPDVLQVADLSILDLQQCEKIFKNKNLTTINHTICAGDLARKQDTCVADSGSPLMCERNSKIFVAGIVSFGFSCKNPSPAIYTKVADFRSWIEESIERYDDMKRFDATFTPA